MMPLTLMSPGEDAIIQRIGGKPEVRQHLENLGFVVGGNVSVINTIGGNPVSYTHLHAFPLSQRQHRLGRLGRG